MLCPVFKPLLVTTGYQQSEPANVADVGFGVGSVRPTWPSTANAVLPNLFRGNVMLLRVSKLPHNTNGKVGGSTPLYAAVAPAEPSAAFVSFQRQ